jgi:hypothetical protein
LTPTLETPTPETELERALCADPEWIAGMHWGKPRPGHPEGAVGLHTIDVLANVDKFARDPDERADLRLVALLHDACKAQTDRGGPDHGTLARELGARYLDDERLLLIIELHDHAYRIYRRRRRDYQERLQALIERLREEDALELYLRFVRCDSQTNGKSPDFYYWLSNELGLGDGG